MMHCLSIVRVPRVTLNVGGAIGDENYTMSGPSFDPRYGGCFQLNEGRREQFFFIFISLNFLLIIALRVSWIFKPRLFNLLFFS